MFKSSCISSHLRLRKIPVYQLSGGTNWSDHCIKRTLINDGDLVVMMIRVQFIFNRQTNEDHRCIGKIATNLALAHLSFCHFQLLSEEPLKWVHFGQYGTFLYVFSTKFQISVLIHAPPKRGRFWEIHTRDFLRPKKN